MATKVKDMAVVTGQYQKDGETKSRYMNVGSMMKSDDGGFFLILDRTFNPAGLPNPEDRSSCIVSLFDPKQNNQQQSQPQPAPPQAGANYGGGDDYLNDSIPF